MLSIHYFYTGDFKANIVFALVYNVLTKIKRFWLKQCKYFT